jgi:hypothetical protein
MDSIFFPFINFKSYVDSYEILKFCEEKRSELRMEQEIIDFFIQFTFSKRGQG